MKDLMNHIKKEKEVKRKNESSKREGEKTAYPTYQRILAKEMEREKKE